MTKKIYQIGDYRDRFSRVGRVALQRCYCDAVRYRQELFASELRGLEPKRRSFSILRLEDLESGIPDNPSRTHPGWDFIYSSELLSSLPAVAARQVIRSAAAKLNPGGRLLLANVSLNAQVRQCYLCHAEGQTYRTELELAELTRDIPEIANAGQAIFRDLQGLNVYLELHRATASLSLCA